MRWSSDERLEVRVDLEVTDTSYELVPVSGGMSLQTPDYPLSDLCSPLLLTALVSGEQLTIDNRPRPDATHWQAGRLVIEAADGSGLVLSPRANDPATVSLAINGEPEAVVREWSDGFQVSCPPPIVCR